MREPTLRTIMLAVPLSTAVPANGPSAADETTKGSRMTAHEFAFTSIDGEPMPMTQFAGKAVLLVNTASQCGFTPQYEALETVWRAYRERGLAVLAVPSNDFGGQEPGSEKEIKRFCDTAYGIDFPMTGKQRVLGPKAHPLYRWIARELGEDHAPKWNFHKYLLDGDGNLAGAWPSRVEPDSDEVRGAIEAALPNPS